ncbi:MAG: PRC and DUF2382 domain-containing protein [Ornithinimicrobium sp.]
MITTDQMQGMIDNDAVVVDADGDKVGKIGRVYLDDTSGNPEWVTVKTGLFGTSETFVPLSAANLSDDTIRVPYDKATIKDAPRMDADEHLSPEQEDDLYRHYQDVGGEGAVEADGRRGDGDRHDHDGHDHDPQEGHHDHDDHDRHRHTDGDGDSMVRSEEQVHVGKEKVEAGRARLRKYVVTEDVTTTVPVEREEVRLEREPISEADARDGNVVSDGDLGEQEQEVVLTEERVKVEKETVPVEKVNLGTDTVTDEQQVSEEVRKEQVEADLPDGHDDNSQRHDGDR